jgi:hypothetical protein
VVNAHIETEHLQIYINVEYLPVTFSPCFEHYHFACVAGCAKMYCIWTKLCLENTFE